MSAQHIQQYNTQADYNAGEHLYPNVSLVGSDLIYVKDAPTGTMTLSVQVGKDLVVVEATAIEGVCGLVQTDIENALPEGASVNDVVGVTINSGACSIEGFNMQGEKTLLESIDFEESAYPSFTFGVEAFKDCSSLTTIDTDRITFSRLTISDYAFEGCSSLREVYFAAVSNMSLGYRAFADCLSLSSVTLVYNGVADLGQKVFGNTDKNLTIYVPTEYLNDYKNTYPDYHFDVYNPK